MCIGNLKRDKVGKFKINKGLRHGCCWERKVFKSIYLNDALKNWRKKATLYENTHKLLWILLVTKSYHRKLRQRILYAKKVQWGICHMVLANKF